VLVVATLRAQQPAPTPAFEVVSIKPNPSADRGSRIDVQPGGRVIWTNTTLESLIGASYQRFNFDNREVVGGPPWIDSDRFDIIAQAPAGAVLTSPDGFPGPLFAMIRAMLAERFRLVLHEEQRERPIYTLSLVNGDGRLGPRLTPSTIDCAAVMKDMAAGRWAQPLPSGRPPCAMGGPPGQFASDGLEIANLASALSSLVGRPVIDRTGLTGAFDWNVEFAPESAVPNPNDDPAPSSQPSDRPSIFTALREQLGLKLQPGRGPVSVLVVDRVEPPTPN